MIRKIDVGHVIRQRTCAAWLIPIKTHPTRLGYEHRRLLREILRGLVHFERLRYDAGCWRGRRRRRGMDLGRGLFTSQPRRPGEGHQLRVGSDEKPLPLTFLFFFWRSETNSRTHKCANYRGEGVPRLEEPKG